MHNPRNSSRWRKLQKWESHREEFYEIYMVKDNTLEATMQIMNNKYGFVPSKRGYKEKLKDWGYQKYLNAAEMRFNAAKYESRAEQGENGETSPAAGTPQGITYHTPLPLNEINNESQSENQINDRAFPRHTTDHATVPGSESKNDHLAADRNLAEESSARFHMLDVPLSCRPESVSTSPTVIDGDHLVFDPCSSPNTAHEGMPGIVNEMSVQEVHDIAQRHKKKGHLAEAASEYLRLIDILGRQTGCDSAVVFEALAQLADIYQAQRKLPESIAAYRKVLTGYTKIFGSSALETLRVVHCLGKAMEESDSYEEAEACYREAISGFEKLGANGLLDQLDCQGFLGDSVSDMGRYEEGLEILLPILDGYKELGLTHRRISVSGSLVEIYLNLKSANEEPMQEILQDMHNLLDETIDIGYHKYPEVLVEGIHLGSVYVRNFQYDLAESLMSRVIPKLEFLDDAKYEIEKIYGYIEYGNVNLRLERLDEAEHYLHFAKAGLEKLNRHDDPVVAFVDARLNEVLFRLIRPSQLSEGFALSRERLMAMIGVTVQCSDEDVELVVEGSRTIIDDTTDADTASYKYGVTLSMTDITGVSISEFLAA